MMPGLMIVGGYLVVVLSLGWWGLAVAAAHIGILVIAARKL